MPTIDELAPATAAADTDEYPSNQNGITRKVTRAQLLAGMQTALSIPGGTLLGRNSSGNGAPETVAVGTYLTLAGGTLSAQAAPYSIALSPSGLIPAAGDLVGVSQGGINVAVSYSVFLQGLSSIANVNGSALLVTPGGGSVSMSLAQLASSVLPLSGGTMTGALALAGLPATPSQAANKQYVDSGLAGYLPLSGGALSGYLTLSGTPASPLHAATKQYVDANPAANGVVNVLLPPCNARFDGVTDDTPAFIAAYQLTPAGGTIYVPNGSTVLQPCTSWGIPLTKYVKWVVDGTTTANGTPLGDAIPGGGATPGVILPALSSGVSGTSATLSQGASEATDFSVSHVSYVVNHSGGASQTVISNSRTDTVISGSPYNNVWSGMDRLVWTGSQTPSSTSPSRHVGRYVQAIRESVGTGSSGNPLPQPQMWSGYFQLLDSTGSPSSWTNASTGLEVDWIGNGVDDANQRQIQSLTIGQYSMSGAAVEVSAGLAVSLASGSTGKIYRVFDVAVPFSMSVLDTTAATQLSGAAAIRMAAGHAIAFEPTNSVALSYPATGGAITAHYGTTACAVGRGLSVAYGLVFATSATVPASSAGSIIFLVGTSSYTVTLPAAATLAPGTGFTFSVLGPGAVTLATASGDTLDLSPVVLRQYDRYHIVSDGSSVWREVFRSNNVSPHFTGPPVLPSYTVAALPTAPGAGGKAFTTNGRKPSEVAGAGTGVEVFFDGSHWISVCSGQPVAA